MPKLNTGEIAPLNVTKEAQWRVVAGLGWDPMESGLLGKAKALARGKSAHHDLDLSCYIYDAQGRSIGEVSAAEDRMSDQTGKIYHSGDSIEGVGDGDDEQISVELKVLDAAIHSVIFVVSIKSGHSFGEVAAPEVRLADGYSGHNFLYVELGADKGADRQYYIFARITRGEENAWMLHFIDEYGADNRAGDISGALKKYL